jgi:hypothetical protein
MDVIKSNYIFREEIIVKLSEFVFRTNSCYMNNDSLIFLSQIIKEIYLR